MKKEIGIIETLKAATSEAEVVKLTKKISEYDQVSDKTVRKFSRIQRRIRAKLRKIARSSIGRASVSKTEG